MPEKMPRVWFWPPWQLSSWWKVFIERGADEDVRRTLMFHLGPLGAIIIAIGGPGSALEQFDRIEATFQPRRTDDLKAGAVEWIGRRVVWDVAWLITDEDGGPYVGEFACTLAEVPNPPPGFVWVPSGDLADFEVVG